MAAAVGRSGERKWRPHNTAERPAGTTRSICPLSWLIKISRALMHPLLLQDAYFYRSSGLPSTAISGSLTLTSHSVYLPHDDCQIHFALLCSLHSNAKKLYAYILNRGWRLGWRNPSCRCNGNRLDLHREGTEFEPRHSGLNISNKPWPFLSINSLKWNIYPNRDIESVSELYEQR
jgi:hypothetical protein